MIELNSLLSKFGIFSSKFLKNKIALLINERLELIRLKPRSLNKNYTKLIVSREPISFPGKGWVSGDSDAH